VQVQKASLALLEATTRMRREAIITVQMVMSQGKALEAIKMVMGTKMRNKSILKMKLIKMKKKERRKLRRMRMMMKMMTLSGAKMSRLI
jgi:hypothetical protein